MSLEMLLAQFDCVIETAEDAEKLNAAILDWAVRGKLIADNSSQHAAESIIQESMAEQKELYKKKRIPKPAKVSDINLSEIPFLLPDGWAWTRAMNICTYIQRGKSPKYSEIERYPVISQKCIQWSGFDISRARFIDPNSLSKYQSYRFLQDGDLLWNSTGVGTLGRITVYRTHVNPHELAVADSHVTILRPSSKVNSDYLNLWFSSPFVQERIDSKSSGTTKQTELNTSTVQEHLVALPPWDVQKRIVARVDELLAQTQKLAAELERTNTQRRKVFTSITHHLTHANGDGPAATWPLLAANFDRLLTDMETVNELKQAILQLAVQGRLVLQDPNDEPASALLERIAAEKAELAIAGKIRKEKKLPPISAKEKPYQLPKNWEWVRICTIASIGTGATPLRTNLNYWEGGTIPWVTSSATNNLFVTQASEYVTELALAETNLTLYPKHTLLVAMYGQGKTRGQIAELLIETTTNQACAAIVLNGTAQESRAYLKLFFQKNYEDLRSLAEGGAQPNLNLGKIKKTCIPFPPLEEQKRIVARVEELLALCDRLAGQLTSTHSAREHLLDAILAQAS